MEGIFMITTTVSWNVRRDFLNSIGVFKLQRIAKTAESRLVLNLARPQESLVRPFQRSDACLPKSGRT